MTIITLPTRIDTTTNNRLMPELYWPPAPIKKTSTSDATYNYSAYNIPLKGIHTFYQRHYLLQADTDQNTSSGKEPLYEATEQDEQAPFKQRTGRQIEEEMFDAGIMCFHDVLAALKEH